MTGRCAIEPTPEKCRVLETTVEIKTTTQTTITTPAVCEVFLIIEILDRLLS